MLAASLPLRSLSAEVMGSAREGEGSTVDSLSPQISNIAAAAIAIGYWAAGHGHGGITWVLALCRLPRKPLICHDDNDNVVWKYNLQSTASPDHITPVILILTSQQFHRIDSLTKPIVLLIIILLL